LVVGRRGASAFADEMHIQRKLLEARDFFDRSQASRCK
jgi:hypothetical protein